MSDEVKFKLENHSKAHHGECFNLGGNVLLPAKGSKPGSGTIELPLAGLAAAVDLPVFMRARVVRVYLGNDELTAEQLIGLVKQQYGAAAATYGDKPVKAKRQPMQIVQLVQARPADPAE
jgi:hypothetical protein